ncbi:UDP-2,3-diacylglucosamine diphosphatase [Robiginitalea marina]|uniref:UDP-2,3-diacylglucosamine diphosphatase n=1 Tax=Robiginitalea marina TaxID=2954105 RepID=A0ABT1AUY6_9FLAO|nr:UDP-2,3-diacylglucosamine diphosphatase [Robiginitalea marina]MCO5723479.1 UDP-2,3-diacylglucosamine diphosphatase [Robiginitalea marina]
MKKRKIDIAVISDIHLGSPRCHAEELLAYLSSINPATLVLNGDIIDTWELKNKYFPPSHFKVLKKILSMAAGGTQVYYLCGNRDEGVHRFNQLSLGNLHIRNKLLLELDGKKAWFFHGDVFDLSIRQSKWVARLGSRGYSLLLLLNRQVNRGLKRLGKEPVSRAKHLREGNEKADRYAMEFEKTVSSLAIDKGYHYVACAHIHQPKKAWVESRNGKTLYLNSGDWVEHLTALEYAFKRWKLYRYNEDKLSPFFADEDLKEMDMQDLIAAIVKQQEIRLKDPEGSPSVE